MHLGPSLQTILDALLTKSEPSRRVTLDELAEEIGVLAVSTDEINTLIEALEANGRAVDAGTSGKASEHLRGVLTAARALRGELGRTPTHAEIAARAGLTLAQVRHALALSKVMQR